MANGEAETPANEPLAEQPTERPATPRSRWRRWWLWALLVLLVAAAAGSAIGINMGVRQGGPLASQGAGNRRPTIIVATPALASPSPSAFVSASPSSVSVAAGTPTASVTTAARTYVVQPGDTLRSIAEEQYGDSSAWPRVYQANRDVIGDDPDALKAGMTLQLPPA